MNTTSVRRVLIMFLTVVAGIVVAEPVLQTSPCPACHGKRSLSLTPPNLGQYDGEIGVMPGRPFTSHRFDVKYKTCPLCEGSGRRQSYRLFAKVPNEATNLDICPECHWAGVTPCRKCKGTGYQECGKCRSGIGQKGGKPGWIVTQKTTTTGMRSSMKHAKTLVTPCGSCSGIGRIVCPDCLGKGGTVCRRCHGAGGLPKKEKR